MNKDFTLQVGVKALIRNNDGKFLFIQRNRSLYPDTLPGWDIPGGRIDPSEPLETALAREVTEEIGLTIASHPHIIYAQDIFPSAGRHIVRLTYLAQASGTIILGAEHSDYAWFSRETALLEELDPFVREVLEHANRLH
jgi:8-oxo-dGTP diphosphatase